MASVPIPQGSTLEPLQAVPIPKGATIAPINGSGEESGIHHIWNWLNKGLISPENIVEAARTVVPAIPSYQQLRDAQNAVPKEGESPLVHGAKVGVAGAVADTADQASGLTSPLAVGTAGVGAASRLPGAVGTVAKVAAPVVGAAMAGQGASQVVDAGTSNTPEAWQQRLQGGAMVAGGVAGGSEGVKSGYEASKAAWEARRASPMSKVMPSASSLPPQAQAGVEDVFRAAAPTGTNVGFRDNVIAAAGDLAEIGQKAKLAEAKGGIVNPDMRVRETVDAIKNHLDEMYQKERAPQIAAHADAPVDIPLGDATRGLEFIKRSGGTLADQALAEKAIKTGTLTLAEADKLAQTANQYLKSYESMTASEKLEAISKTPKIGGLKALDVALGKNMNEVLTSNGEVGLRSYERRYAALSEVRDQLQSRINATELDQPGFIKKVARPVMGVLTGGKSGLASASAAATADVNIGRRLQFGLQKLANSGITAGR